MAPGRSTDARAGGDAASDRRLLEIAARSIKHGLETGRPLLPPAEDLTGDMARPGATFVTLEIGDDLRGCIGTMTARRALGLDVAHNAFAAAFQDTRFERLSRAELADLSISISILGPLEPMAVRSTAELLAALRPGVDGLVLSDADRRSVFLPQVWDALPTPSAFVDALRRKGGFAPDEGPPNLTAEWFVVREVPARRFADLAEIG
jgi:AmmeMemoRadiSam system protein A